MRQAGILLPVASLPSDYGIGSFSKEGYEFIDFLQDSGQKLWQILPLGPTSYGDSPYQSFSTFAGNPYFIDPESMVEQGFLTQKELKKYDFGSDPEDTDYSILYKNRFKMLKAAFKSWHGDGGDKMPHFKYFCKDREDWLLDYSLFMALKDAKGGKEWLLWEEPLRLRDKMAIDAALDKYSEDVLFYSFCQYYFYEQWALLKAKANKKGIKIIGDIPIYVAMDSSDVWANPSLFQLDEDCIPKAVAGVPPDYFSATGQLWGNPLYDWEAHKSTGYKWWVSRLKVALSLYDVIRIDHFRGFEAYYSVPYGDKTAEFGQWEKGPDYDLFKVFGQEIGKKLPIIAEDLGVITPPVRRLIKKCGYPGMKILQFAFDNGDCEYLPHNHVKDCIIYTGTHDNNTTLGWYQEANRKTKRFLREYMDLRTIKDINSVMIRAALSSTADTAIIPLQDYLGLDGRARVNMPGTIGTNWRWRLKKDALTPELAARIKTLTQLYGRL